MIDCLQHHVRSYMHAHTYTLAHNMLHCRQHDAACARPGATPISTDERDTRLRMALEQLHDPSGAAAAAVEIGLTRSARLPAGSSGVDSSSSSRKKSTNSPITAEMIAMYSRAISLVKNHVPCAVGYAGSAVVC